MVSSPLKIAVLLSGSGRTLQNLIDEQKAGRLNIDIRVVVGSKARLMGIERARAAGIRSAVVDRKSASSGSDFSAEVFSFCAAANVDLICLAGWLCHLELPVGTDGKGIYENRILNIHPSLLPSFGGKGMYGNRVHQAVIDYGCKVSGCTVHFVDGQYDNGPVVLQRTCPVRDDDTAETLARRVFEQETLAYPEAVRLFQQGRLRVEQRRVRILEHD